MFMADLVRAMGARVTLDFIAVSSYAKSTKSSGEVRMLKDLDTSLEGRHVIIVEDIVDTGLTLTYLQDILARASAEIAEDGVPAQQAVAAQGRRRRRLHRLHDRGSIRGRLRARLRGEVPQSRLHRGARRRMKRFDIITEADARVIDYRGDRRAGPGRRGDAAREGHAGGQARDRRARGLDGSVAAGGSGAGGRRAPRDDRQRSSAAWR